MSKKIFLMFAAFFILSISIFALKIETSDGSTDNSLQPEMQNVLEELRNQKIKDFLDTLTPEEKAAQLFVVLPEMLIKDVSCVTAAGAKTQEALNEIPVGGFIYMSSNLESEQQVTAMLSNTQKYSMERIGLPAFLCLDEEGGSVRRISRSGKFDVPEIEDMSLIGETQDAEKAYEAGAAIGSYLSRMGFNVDFAPVADVLSNSENKVVRERSFGEEPENVAKMSKAFSEGLLDQKVFSSYKHFPGHGATAGDTHEGYAYTEKTLEQLKNCELIPFQSGIEEGVPFIMVGHISVPNITGDYVPSSISEHMIQQVLREEMGYDGIVITDAMNMGAIVQQYSSAEAAVKSLQAGADMVLMPKDFYEAYEGVLQALEDGSLSQERIDESLTRILRVKLQLIDEFSEN